MSQWIRKLLGGQPMSRREFLSGTAGAAAAAAANRVPVPATPAAGAVERELPFILRRVQLMNHPSQGVIIRDIVDELPDGTLNMPAGDASWMAAAGQQKAGSITRDDYVTILQEASRARKALQDTPGDGRGVQFWNPATGQWESRYFATRFEPRSAESLAADRAYRKELKQRGEYEELGEWGPIESTEPMEGDFGTLEEALAFGNVDSPEVVVPDLFGPESATLQEFGYAYGHGPDPYPERRVGRAKEKAAKENAGQQNAEQAAAESLGRKGGGWHNVGPDPFKSEPWSMTTGGLEGYERPAVQSATSSQNIRKMLGRMAPAVAVGVGVGAASQQQSPVTKELLK